jgi:hypothetical protein
LQPALFDINVIRLISADFQGCGPDVGWNWRELLAGPLLQSVDPGKFPWGLFASIGDALAAATMSDEAPPQVWMSVIGRESPFVD